MNLFKSILILCLLFIKEAINFNYEHLVVQLDFSDVFNVKMTLQ
jgi:hypothetical protein